MTIFVETAPNSPLPARHRWTRERFERAIDAGVFGPDAHLELIDGEITEKMSPQNSPHSAAIGAMQFALEEAFSQGHWVRVQLPLAVTDTSQPEPDLAVVVGSWRDYARTQPTTAVIVVEISDTTLAFDRSVKASLYAQAAVPEYWIVNLRDRVIEIHRQPAPMAEQPFGHHYRSITRHDEQESISLLATPAVAFRVSELLP